MSDSDREAFNNTLAAVLKAHGVDPAGTGPVPFEKMESIGRQLRLELERKGVTREQMHERLDWLLPEILDKSMTAAGRNLAIEKLGKGLGFKIIWPS